ncbi:MAG: TlpA family protein disulfide reductase [Saprospiraceae bacterium]|nr:TlpA family protein disulfide reductase [Saprospiraceae bacterium]
MHTHYAILVFLSFILQLGYSSAQETHNVLIMGKVNNPTSYMIQLDIDKSFIDNTLVGYNAAIREDGRFGFTCKIEVPQTAILTYGDQQIEIFLQPNDTLVVDFDALQLEETLKFSGLGGANNQLWRQFRAAFPVDENIFKYRYYRKSIYQYKIHEDFDKVMWESSEEEYISLIKRELLKKQGFIQFFEQSNPDTLTGNFLAYLEGELSYTYYFQLLSYGHVYGRKHRTDSSFLDFMDTIQFQNDLCLGHSMYRDFMMAWVNYQCMQKNVIPDNIYIQHYYFAKKSLKALTGYFITAEIIAESLKKKEEVEVILPIYEDFLMSNPYLELDQIVVDAFQKARQFAAGTPAPTFSLQDIHGQTVSLRDFQGKVIYIDFWATWCRPCIKKMHRLQSLEAMLAHEDVVFLHISLDKKEETWRDYVQQHQFRGVHLINDPNLPITENYEVLSVPKFFIITKEGNFAFTPSSSDQQVLEEAIRSLLDR